VHEADEGVIKFAADHRDTPLDEGTFGSLARVLGGWRAVLRRAGLIGRDPLRYSGAGYGNVSARVGDGPPGRRPFLITGTQTAHRADLSLDDYCVVERYDPPRNRVSSTGGVLPSSESMTHGSLYDLSPDIRAVLHGHSPALWRRAVELDVPVSDPAVPYGTPAMAAEVERLYAHTNLAERGVLAMGGHKDGVIAVGSTVEQAGTRLVAALARAWE